MSLATDRLEIPATREAVAVAQAFCVDGGRQAGLAGERLSGVDLVVEEVLVNIASYAYPAGGGVIEVSRQVEAEWLTLEVADAGVPFDPLASPPADTTSPIEERRIGGYGILFLRQLADEVCYRREDGRNILTIRFRR